MTNEKKVIRRARGDAEAPGKKSGTDGKKAVERPKKTTATSQGAAEKKRRPDAEAAGRRTDEAAAERKKRRGAAKRAQEEETAVLHGRPTDRAAQREQRRTRREEDRRRIRAAERHRVMESGGGVQVGLMTILTLIFEAAGLLLAGVNRADTWMALAIMAPLTAFSALLLPRFWPMDALLAALCNILCAVSVVILCTVSPQRGVKQAQFYAIGTGVMMLMSMLTARFRRLRQLTALAMVLGIGALILPLAFGEWNSGAKNWVKLPFFGSFQPSEFVKLSLILVLAYSFSAHRTLGQMMPALLFAAACLGLLMLQRDLGTALVYYLTTLMLFYAACGNLPLTILGMGGGAAAAMLGYRMFAHVKVRVAMWRNPWVDPLGKGYQIIQALLAIGSGGLFGVGLGNGTPEKIPAYYNDFIFAVICEQLGILFGLMVLAVYVLICLRGIAVSLRARRSFEMLLGSGVVILTAIQTLMIVGGVIKMIPLTGVTMPFLSYGGSSLISCMAMMGVLHGLSGRAREELEEDILTGPD